MLYYPALKWFFFMFLAFGVCWWFKAFDFVEKKVPHLPWWWVGCLFAGSFLIGAWTWGKQSVVMHTTKIEASTHKLFLRTGWVNIQQMELPLRQIESMSVDQDMWGKIFDYGTITFFGTGGRRPQAFWVCSPSALTAWIGERQGDTTGLQAAPTV